MIRSFLKGGIFYKTPQLHENASISKDSDIVNKWYVDTKVGNTQIDTKQYVDTKVSNAQTTAKQYTDSTQASTRQYVDSRVASIPIVNESSFVNISGNQNINGTKSFNSSPTVPSPSASTHAANKAYVDSKTSGGSYQQWFNTWANSGWTKLPNGLIIQWGFIYTSSVSVNVTLPIAFPNANLVQLATVGHVTKVEDMQLIGIIPGNSRSDFKVVVEKGQVLVNWITIGY